MTLFIRGNGPWILKTASQDAFYMYQVENAEAVNKGQKPFTNEINKAIKEMEADGEYNALIHKWFGNVPGFNYKELER